MGSSVKKRMIGLIVPIWLVGMSFSAAKAPLPEATLVDFSGSWTLNRDKADFGTLSQHSAPLTINIRQEADSISIERTSKRGSGEVITYVEKFSMKGSSAESMIKATKKVASVEWSADGQSLTEKSNYKDYGNDIAYTATETWTLLDNGQTLIIDRQDVMPDGNTYPTKYVYDRSATK